MSGWLQAKLELSSMLVVSVSPTTSESSTSSDVVTATYRNPK